MAKITARVQRNLNTLETVNLAEDRRTAAKLAKSQYDRERYETDLVFRESRKRYQSDYRLRKKQEQRQCQIPPEPTSSAAPAEKAS